MNEPYEEYKEVPCLMNRIQRVGEMDDKQKQRELLLQGYAIDDIVQEDKDTEEFER